MKDMAMETKENPKCPNCNVGFETTHVGDAYAGDVLVTTWVEYCPECLYINDSRISLSK